MCALIIIGLAIGLGVGLSEKNDDNHHASHSTSDLATSPNVSNQTNWWKPVKETTWDYRLQSVPKSTNTSIEVYDIDLFDSSVSTIKLLQQKGHKVVCYFSAGSFEDWRPDKSKFDDEDLGEPLDGWKGEKWLNIKSTSVKNIMIDRIQLAVNKSCDGIDPDNLDGYDNDTGLNLTKQDSIDYVAFLSNAAHSKNISVGLKNCGDIVNQVISHVDWVVQEQCIEYEECDKYYPFIKNNKPVFNVEYPVDDDQVSINSTTYDAICDYKGRSQFSTIIKHMDLDDWIRVC